MQTNMNEIRFAKIGDKVITYNDIIRTIQDMGPQGQGLHSEEGIQQVANELVNQELLLLEAKEKNFEDEEDFKKSLSHMKDELMKQYAMQKIMTGVKVEDEEIKEYFDNNSDRFKGLKMDASHILIDEKKEAEKIYKKIQDGKSFADAAKEYSNCPSKEEGGNLGSFGPGMMVPEFDEAAQNAPINEVMEPIKTQFGYHIILVHDRKEEAEKFDDVKARIKNELLMKKQQNVYIEITNGLKEKYEVEYFEDKIEE